MELTPWQVELLSLVPRLAAEGEGVLPESAYGDGSPADEEFKRLTRDEAGQSDRADIVAVEASLDRAGEGVVLAIDEAEAWLRVVGKARLVLGDRLGVTSNAWESDDSMEETPELGLLHYLSWIQSSLVDVLTDQLPDPV